LPVAAFLKCAILILMGFPDWIVKLLAFCQKNLPTGRFRGNIFTYIYNHLKS